MLDTLTPPRPRAGRPLRTLTYRDAVRLRFSADDVRRRYRAGAMSERDFYRFLRLWTWARFPKASVETEQWYATRGETSYRARANRAFRVVAAICDLRVEVDRFGYLAPATGR